MKMIVSSFWPPEVPPYAIALMKNSGLLLLSGLLNWGLPKHETFLRNEKIKQFFSTKESSPWDGKGKIITGRPFGTPAG